MNSGELIDQCEFLTHRKLDYWCHHGIFDDNKVATRRSIRRDFSEDELKIARVLARVSHAFDEWSNGRGGFIAVYRAIANQIRDDHTLIKVVLAAGIELDVHVEPAPPAATPQPDMPPEGPAEVHFIPGVGADNA